MDTMGCEFAVRGRLAAAAASVPAFSENCSEKAKLRAPENSCQHTYLETRSFPVNTSKLYKQDSYLHFAVLLCKFYKVSLLLKKY